MVGAGTGEPPLNIASAMPLCPPDPSIRRQDFPCSALAITASIHIRNPAPAPILIVSDAVSDELIVRYESIGQASARMLETARCGDWPGLAAAEAECERLISALQAVTLQTAQALDPVHQRQRISVLRKILRHDAEIRVLTQHWLPGLERLLCGAGLNHLARGIRHAPQPARNS